MKLSEKGLIFVIDSNDQKSMIEAKDEFQTLLGLQELRNAVILMYANKQDLPTAMNPVEINEKLGLHTNCNCDLNNDRTWYVQKACAINGDGLNSGMQK